jgi:hypothetical protein
MFMISPATRVSQGHVPPSDVQQPLTRVFQSVCILSSTSFSFPAAVPTELAPPAQVLNPEARQRLVRALRDTLYSQCFSRALNGSNLADQIPETIAAPDLLSRLSAANRGRDAWLPGWRVQEIDAGGLVVVTKGGQRRIAKPGDYVMTFAEEVPPCIGCAVTLRVRKESKVLQEGTYCALGEELPRPEDGIDVVRIYFNASQEAAILIVELVTTYLNEWRVPFTLKIMLRPQDQDRSDAIVLYLPKNRYQHFVNLLEKFPAPFFSKLKREVPLLTKLLYGGIGLAESPMSDESFGMHRCRLIAEGIVDAWLEGRQDVEARQRAVERRFISEGLILALPYLNPGSEDIYSLTPAEESSNARSVSRTIEKPIALTAANVVAYLRTEGLGASESETEAQWSVSECSSRNRNFAVICSDNGQGFFVKQLRVQDPESFRMMQREAAIYRLAQQDSDFEALKKLMPQFFHFDTDSKVIILELVNGQSLMQSQQRLQQFAVESGLGHALAILHQQVGCRMSASPPPNIFALEAPGIFTAHRGGPLVRWLGAGQMRLIKQVREHTLLSQGLDELASSWHYETFMHGDIKFENAMIPAATRGGAAAAASSNTRAPIKLVDWELADFGEACWDVGSVFQAYLSLSLRAARAHRGITLSERLKHSTMQVDSLRHAIKAFWQRYCQESDLDESSRRALLERSLRCASARLIQMALEVMHGKAQPTPVALSLFEVSVELMTRTWQTAQWLGLDETLSALA